MIERQPLPYDPAHMEPDPAANPTSTTEPPEISRPSSATPTEAQLEQEMPGAIALTHDPYAALRIGSFRLYETGWIASVIGQQVQSVAVQWHIANRVGATGNPALALGLVGAVQAIPVIALALPAGQLADRRDRRQIIMYSQLIAAIASIGMAIVSHVDGSVSLLYALLFASAIAQAVGWPARSALLPQIVPDELFPNAATWNSSAFQVASVAGPALGGLLVGFSSTAAFVLDACAAMTFFVLISRVKARPVKRTKEAPSFASLVAGVRFVFKNQIILGAITLDLFVVLLGGATYLLPMYAQQVLHVGAGGFGWLRAAPAVGAFIMAIVIAHRPPMKKAGATMLWSVAGFGAATVVFAVSKSFILSLIALAMTGAFDNISVVVRHTLVQMLPPERMRGRVSAVNNVFIGASNEIGGFESGLSASLLARPFGETKGAIASVLLGGIGSIAVVGLIAVWAKPLRRFGSLADARPLEDEAAV